MNLQFYDKKSTLGKVRDDLNPTICLYPKNGFIRLNHRACELMVLGYGQRMMLAQDESSPKDWYIMKTESLAGFTLRAYKGSKTLQMQSRAVVTMIIQSLEIQQQKPIAFQLASTPTVTKDHQLFAILYKNHS